MSYRIEIVERLARVDRDAWDRLVASDDPFTEHAFLDALEESGSVGGRSTGWKPRHVLVWQGRELVGAAPLYEKMHSYGEFVFDFGWAEGARRARIPYYPKLVGAVPFTPVTGRRLLVAPGANEREVVAKLVEGAKDVMASSRASSIHFLFLTAAEAEPLTELGFVTRLAYQFHLQNPGGTWRTFDDYVAAMRNASRKQVRRERSRARAHGLDLVMVRGDEMSDWEWRALYPLYESTSDRKGGGAYLTEKFFHLMRARLSHRVVASFAERNGVPVAGALFLWKGGSLYGRYWGTLESLDSMHFELCYYLPIEWALPLGMQRFEAGAQGEHKLKRGLVPHPCRSAHFVRHPDLGRAIGEYLNLERHAIQREMDIYTAHGPFRRSEED